MDDNRDGRVMLEDFLKLKSHCVQSASERLSACVIRKVHDASGIMILTIMTRLRVIYGALYFVKGRNCPGKRCAFSYGISDTEKIVKSVVDLADKAFFIVIDLLKIFHAATIYIFMRNTEKNELREIYYG